MKIKILNPNQIITLNDYPIHNEQILKLYFRMFHKGKRSIVPPCPVISKDLLSHNFNNKLKNLFMIFEIKNPQAKYFLLDGSHKTTAATLSNKKIPVMIFKSDKDVQSAKRLVDEGEIISLTTGATMRQAINILKRHFNKTKSFQTVEEKTNKMVVKKKLPPYMIKAYKKEVNPSLKNELGRYIVIRGPLGSGKTTVAKKLIKLLKGKHIAVDEIIDKHELWRYKEEGYISQKSFLKVNKIVEPMSRELLERGKTVIFDGNFFWKSQIEDLVHRLNYPHYVFTLKAPLIVCIKRDSKRNKPHGKDAAIVVYKKTTSFDYGININITLPLNKAIREIMSHLHK